MSHIITLSLLAWVLLKLTYVYPPITTYNKTTRYEYIPIAQYPTQEQCQSALNNYATTKGTSSKSLKCELQ